MPSRQARTLCRSTSPWRRRDAVCSAEKGPSCLPRMPRNQSTSGLGVAGCAGGGCGRGAGAGRGSIGATWKEACEPDAGRAGLADGRAAAAGRAAGPGDRAPGEGDAAWLTSDGEWGRSASGPVTLWRSPAAAVAALRRFRPVLSVSEGRLPSSGMAEASETSTIAPHRLQRIFSSLFRTFSSGMEYLARHSWQRNFIFSGPPNPCCHRPRDEEQHAKLSGGEPRLNPLLSSQIVGRRCRPAQPKGAVTVARSTRAGRRSTVDGFTGTPRGCEPWAGASARALSPVAGRPASARSRRDSPPRADRNSRRRRPGMTRLSQSASMALWLLREILRS